MIEDVTEELRKIYKKAREEGIWIYELAPSGTKKRQVYIAAAGSIRKIEALEQKLGEEIDVSKLSLGQIIELTMPGTGRTREEACKNAIKEYKKHAT